MWRNKMSEITEEDRAARTAAREAENLDPAEIPMSLDDLQGQTFIARVAEIATTSEYILDENGQPKKEKGKHPHVNGQLETDFMEEGFYTWKWRVSGSKNGLHAKVLQAIANVRILKIVEEGDETKEVDTGDRGITGLTNIKQLEGHTFRFEKKDLEFGKDGEGNTIVKRNFPMPIDYFLTEEGDGEEAEADAGDENPKTEEA